MENALKELLEIEELENLPLTNIKCAIIVYTTSGYYLDENTFQFDSYTDIDDIEDSKTCILKLNYNQSDYTDFFNSLKEINYDNGYGGQRLFGIVWFNDGSWLERYEYDGAEKWVYKSTPKILDILK